MMSLRKTLNTQEAFSLCLVFYDISVLASPLTWILLLTLIVSIVTQVSCKFGFVIILKGVS